MRRLLISLLCFGLLVGCDDTPNPPAVSPDGERIAVCVTSAGEYAAFMDERKTAVVTMAPDGTDVRRLTGFDASRAQVVWNAAGDRLAFVEDRRALAVVSADGSDHRVLVRGTKQVLTPAFSPDGRWIAYVSSRSILHRGRLMAVPVEGGKPKTLAKNVLPGVAWLPSGEALAVTSPESAPGTRKKKGIFEGELFAASPDTGDTTALDSGLFLQVSLFTVSPKTKEFYWICPVQDGDDFNLALASCHPRTRTIRLADIDPERGAIFYPAVGPESGRLLFVSNPSPEDALEGQLWLREPDGSERAIPVGKKVSFPTWLSEDQILYVSGGKRLLVASPDGDAPLDLTSALQTALTSNSRTE